MRGTGLDPGRGKVSGIEIEAGGGLVAGGTLPECRVHTSQVGDDGSVTAAAAAVESGVGVVDSVRHRGQVRERERGVLNTLRKLCRYRSGSDGFRSEETAHEEEYIR